jgi:DNA-binding transcriptional LysR family regulator
MDLKSLRCFTAVAEKLNFSRAAESLYLSQPALSLRIAALEEELGIPLFRRTHQNVYLTEAGSKLLPEVQDLLLRFDTLPQLARTANTAEDVNRGRIDVSLDSTMPETMMRVLRERFSAFYLRYPDVHVEINSLDFSQYESALLSRSADLCFIGFKESEYHRLNPLFNCITLDREPMVIAYVGDQEESLEQLMAQRELLLLDGEDRWNMVLLNHLDMVRLHPNMRTVRGGPALCVNLTQKKTATSMPASFFDSLDIPDLHCCELGIPESDVISCIVWDKVNYNPALQLLINCFEPQNDNISK